jgi:glutathione S-transferase
MTGFPLTIVATLLILLVYVGFGTVVSRARGRYGVAAPAVTGNADFERRYRVQMNTLEQLPIVLPLLWLTAGTVGDAWAALGGLVWCVGRVIYARAYYAEAARRDLGFTISAVPVVAMLGAVIVALVLRWV